MQNLIGNNEFLEIIGAIIFDKGVQSKKTCVKYISNLYQMQ